MAQFGKLLLYLCIPFYFLFVHTFTTLTFCLGVGVTWLYYNSPPEGIFGCFRRKACMFCLKMFGSPQMAPWRVPPRPESPRSEEEQDEQDEQDESQRRMRFRQVPLQPT